MGIIQEGEVIQNYSGSSLLQLVRISINDFTEPYHYTNEQLIQMIAVATTYVNVDTGLSYVITYNNVGGGSSYAINYNDYTISPEPTGIVANLITLKVCYMISMGEMKKAAGKSFTLTDGPSSINMTGQYKAYKEVYDTCKEEYGRLLFLFKIDGANHYVITTPYTFENAFQWDVR